MKSSGPPTPEEQIAFLRQLQRLLDEGSFTATYKYALLHAIADLCVTRGDDSGDDLTLDAREIAEKFVELYWRQSVPFPAGESMKVLAQNTGRQAAVVRELGEMRSTYGERFAEFKRKEERWGPLVRSVERDVWRYPVRYLQNVGQETVDFLYEIAEGDKAITLKPGVAFCFRSFYPLIVDLVEGAWSHFVRRLNHDVLGTTTDLRSFLFGSDRAALERFRPIFRDVQDDRCLYCGDPFAARKLEVDHFIPWRRYPTDLGHNFVLAHATCNSRKGDRLAAEAHLVRWRDRNVEHADLLAERFDDARVLHDLPKSWQVTRWAYRQVELAEGQVWVEDGVLTPLSGGWEEALRVGG